MWSNLTDLIPGTSRSLTFSTSVDAATYPLGAAITNKAQAASSTDPRDVPQFDNVGAPLANPNVVSASATTTATVTAMKVDKASGTGGDATPEAELLRGVNDHPTVYSLTVTNNVVGATQGVVVDDYLPAGLEFLGCGGSFNSTIPEYPSATNSTMPVAGCQAPTASTTSRTLPDTRPASTRR